ISDCCGRGGRGGAAAAAPEERQPQCRSGRSGRVQPCARLHLPELVVERRQLSAHQLEELNLRWQAAVAATEARAAARSDLYADFHY
ncbi:hypothetical protein B5X24_HaOG214515, partial [Helicoverpa armigera]